MFSNGTQGCSCNEGILNSHVCMSDSFNLSSFKRPPVSH